MKRGMSKRILAAVAAAVMVIGSMSGCGGSAGSKDSIKIGLLFSKTGPTAITEEAMYNAAMMAVDEINEAGGVKGKKLEPVYEDYGMDPAVAAEKIKKLIMQDKVTATVGLYTSASRIAAEPVIQDNDGLLIYPTYYEGEAPSPNLVYTGAVPNQQGDLFVPYLTENVGKKFFLLGTDTVYMSLINKQCKDLLEKYGGTAVGEEYVPGGHSDFASVITKIKEAKPDVIYCNLNGDSAVAFYKQYKSYGLDSATMPIASFVTDEVTVKALGAQTAAGHYISINYINTIDTEANKAFIEKYKGKYGADKEMTSVGEASYTSVKLLAAALEKTEDYTPAGLKKAMSGMEIDAPQGRIKVDPDNFHIYCKARIGKVNADGNIEVVYESPELIKPDPTKQ